MYALPGLPVDNAFRHVSVSVSDTVLLLKKTLSSMFLSFHHSFCTEEADIISSRVSPFISARKNGNE